MSETAIEAYRRETAAEESSADARAIASPETESPESGLFSPPPSNLPYDDGEPLETPRHRAMMNALIDAAEYHLSQRRSDFFCGGNMFVYYSATQAKNQDFRGPDFFAVLDVENEVQRERKTWAIWDEDGRYPDVIIELMSESTASIDLTEKKHLYERTFRTRNYFVYDPYQPTSLQGWRLDENLTYAPLEPNESGRLWCDMLECWVGVWEGEVNGKFAPWLRFFDRDGNLVPLPKEAVQAELNTTQAELNTTQAELNTTQAELNTTQAELERERQRSQEMAERLRELGFDPNNL